MNPTCTCVVVTQAELARRTGVDGGMGPHRGAAVLREERTLCLVFSYLGPGLPRPAISHGPSAESADAEATVRTAERREQSTRVA